MNKTFCDFCGKEMDGRIPVQFLGSHNVGTEEEKRIWNYVLTVKVQYEKSYEPDVCIDCIRKIITGEKP